MMGESAGKTPLHTSQAPLGRVGGEDRRDLLLQLRPAALEVSLSSPASIIERSMPRDRLNSLR